MISFSERFSLFKTHAVAARTFRWPPSPEGCAEAEIHEQRRGQLPYTTFPDVYPQKRPGVLQESLGQSEFPPNRCPVARKCWQIDYLLSPNRCEKSLLLRFPRWLVFKQKFPESRALVQIHVCNFKAETLGSRIAHQDLRANRTQA
jgi:hypothetical protein